MRHLLFATVAAGLLLATALPAPAAEGPEEHYRLAEKLMKDRLFERASRVLHEMIGEWPEEKKFVPPAHLLLAQCFVEMDQPEKAIHFLELTIEHYPGWEQLTGKAEEWLAKIRRRHSEQSELQRDRVELERIEHDLKEMGLEGRELREAFERAKEEYLRAREAREADRREREKLAKMIEIWKAHGVGPEDIEERVRGLAAERRRAAELAERLHAEARRLHERGVPDREIAERVEALERELREERHPEWRERRERDMDAVRREFLHLAERMGIPGDEAERFLEEHRRRRSGRPFEEGRGPDERQVEELLERFREFEREAAHRSEEMERRTEDLSREVGRAMEEMSKRLERLAERIERLEERER